MATSRALTRPSAAPDVRRRGETSGCSRGRSRSRWSPSSSRRRLAVRQLPGQQRAAEHPDRVRLPRPARRASRSPAATSARRQPVRDALLDGLQNTLRLVGHRDRARHGPRHADRHRPALEELRRAQRGQGLRRVRPQRAAAGDPLPAVHRGGARARSPRSTDAGTTGRWPSCQRPRRRRAVVSTPGTGRSSPWSWSSLAAAWSPSRWRRGGERPDRPAGAPGVCGRSASAFVVGAVAGRARSRHDRPGDRRTARHRRHHDDPRVLRRPGRARRLHGQPHRRDRARFDPGRAAGPGRGGRRAGPLAASSGCGSSCCPRRCASPCRRSATSTST